MNKHIRFIVNGNASSYQQASLYSNRKSSRKRWIFLGISLLTAFAVFAVGAFAYNVYNVKASVIIADPSQKNTLPIVNILTSEVSLPKLKFNEDRINILLMGIDTREEEGDTPETSRTDSIMLVSINTKDKSVVMISIPRDLQVDYKGDKVKINAVHRLAGVAKENDRGAGPGAIMQVVGDTLGIKVHYFARIDFAGFEKVVDAIGGIVVDVPVTLKADYPDNKFGWTKVNIPAGKQTMNGITALQYARARYTTNINLEGDEQRAKRQQIVLLAIKDKIAANPEIFMNFQKIGEMLNILKDSFLTSIDTNEMFKLGQLAKEIDSTNPDKVTSRVLKEPLIYHEDRKGVTEWFFYPTDKSWKGIHDWVQELFTNPSLRDNLTEEAATIQINNGTDTKGLATLVRNSLQSYPFTILNPANTTETYANTTIIDYSSGLKPSTLKFLETYFNAKAIKPEKISANQKADIVVILGGNYAPPEKEENVQ
ncbi:MAG: LCP family protein [bacterium]